MLFLVTCWRKELYSRNQLPRAETRVAIRLRERKEKPESCPGCLTRPIGIHPEPEKGQLPRSRSKTSQHNGPGQWPYSFKTSGESSETIIQALSRSPPHGHQLSQIHSLPRSQNMLPDLRKEQGGSSLHPRLDMRQLPLVASSIVVPSSLLNSD